MTVSDLISELQKHPGDSPVIIFCKAVDGGDGIEAIGVVRNKEEGDVWIFSDLPLWVTRFPGLVEGLSIREPAEKETQEPGPIDLTGMEASVSEASEEIRMENKRRFAEIVSDKMAELIGDHSMSKEDKETLREGYKDLLGGGPQSFPRGLRGLPVTMPAMPVLPPSTYTEEDEDCLVTIDFFCLLSGTIGHKLYLPTMTMILETDTGHNIHLSKGQTKALVRYIRDVSSGLHGYPFNVRKVDEAFLNHPAVQFLLNEDPPPNA